MLFSEQYRYVSAGYAAEAEARVLTERMVASLWYDRLFRRDELTLADGRALRVHSPGWWNHAEGPDFRHADLEVAGKRRRGDVEIHLAQGGWAEHGHHLDSRYNGVILEVLWQSEPPSELARTALGAAVPVLLLPLHVDGAVIDMVTSSGETPPDAEFTGSECARLAERYGRDRVLRFFDLAGEWRMLNKSRLMRERIERAGANQALYEELLTACGFSKYKHHFRVLAEQLHYDRARQLALRDPLLLEAAFLQMAGLLPQAPPEQDGAVPHFGRLHGLRKAHLPGLKSLPLDWRVGAVRPVNRPERRLAGAARIIARTARDGLAQTLDAAWLEDLAPAKRRKALEALFPTALGFWANHYAWTGTKLAKPVALLGAGRVRSIIGNVFVPFALAMARQSRNRDREAAVLAFFRKMPKESENRITHDMVERFFGGEGQVKLNFQRQQGLLQIYHDWCRGNPSCEACAVHRLLAALDGGDG